MECPSCEQHFSYEVILLHEAEDGGEIECPNCNTLLLYSSDESDIGINNHLEISE
jgi:hypothetical protein